MKVFVETLRENINASFESPCLGVFSNWEGARQCLQEAEENLIPRLWNELPEPYRMISVTWKSTMIDA